MYCNNCGEKGHVFRDCRHPIMSCGLILVDSTKLPCNPESVKVLMVRRKHSMAFTDFVRGKYEKDDLDFIKKLVSNMTFEEHEILKSKDFTNIWSIHWGKGHDHHSNEYNLSKEKFECLDINLLFTTEGYKESEWGFPKGRRQHKEDDYNCAIREFSEETNISRESYIVCKNLYLEEVFKGTNNIKYKHLYFISILKESINLNKHLTSEQQREICEIKWMSLDECEESTRPHLIQRKQLLDNLKKTITLFNT